MARESDTGNLYGVGGEDVWTAARRSWLSHRDLELHQGYWDPEVRARLEEGDVSEIVTTDETTGRLYLVPHLGSLSSSQLLAS